MGTANFKTQKDFPLYVVADERFYFKSCPNCCDSSGVEASYCEICGASLKEIEPEFDEDVKQWFCDEVFSTLEEVNEKLTFFRIELKDGYYSDLQLYVELTARAENAGFSEPVGTEWGPDNNSCKYYLDLYLSQAKRKFEAEQRKVNKALKNIAAEYGFIQLACIGRFSNGEAVYTEVNTGRGQLLAAARS